MFGWQHLSIDGGKGMTYMNIFRVLSVYIVAVFTEWKEHMYVYGLFIGILVVVYVLMYSVIRWAMALQLIRTAAYSCTILLLLLGVYIYTYTMNGSLSYILQKLFESIVLFGGLLIITTTFYTWITRKKQKT